MTLVVGEETGWMHGMNRFNGFKRQTVETVGDYELSLHKPTAKAVGLAHSSKIPPKFRTFAASI